MLIFFIIQYAANIASIRRHLGSGQIASNGNLVLHELRFIDLSVLLKQNSKVKPMTRLWCLFDFQKSADHFQQPSSGPRSAMKIFGWNFRPHRFWSRPQTSGPLLGVLETISGHLSVSLGDPAITMTSNIYKHIRSFNIKCAKVVAIKKGP